MSDDIKDDKRDCYCAYCEDGFLRSWSELQTHVLECAKHPLFIANNKIQSLKAQLIEKEALLKSAVVVLSMITPLCPCDAKYCGDCAPCVAEEFLAKLKAGEE